MPIKINLLAEAQAAEEARRHDPVKRGIWIGVFLVLLVLLYIGKLYADILIDRMAYERLNDRWKKISPNSGTVITNLAKIAMIDRRLAELSRLSTNRFYWGTLLNALQQSAIDDIQVTSFRGIQEYSVTNAIAAKTSDGETTSRIPGTSVERITILIDGKDWNYGQQTYDKFRQTLSTNEFFVRFSGSRGFKLFSTLGAPMSDPLNPARSFLTFTLECRFKEVVRRE